MPNAAPHNTHKSTKATRQPTCPQCKKRFRTTSVVKKFCTVDCQKLFTKLKRRVSVLKRATGSAFFYWLAREVERAGTLQILTSHTVESLVELYTVYKLALKANQYGDIKLDDDRFFEISHICAVKAPNAMGLLHPANLVVAPKAMNRSHGVNHYGYGLSIPRATLHPRYNVDKVKSRKALIPLIIKFLGDDVVSEVVTIAKIQSTQYHKDLAYLQEHLDRANPEHMVHLGKLDTMTGKALSALKAEILGKQPVGFRPKTETFTPLRVLVTELERHMAYRPDMAVIRHLIDNLAPEHLVRHSRRSLLTSDQLQALFDVLHGKSVEDVQETFYVIENEERIIPYAPIRITKPVAPVMPVAPVRVLKTFASFADELDEYAPDAPPTLLQGHTATYEPDPLPWG